MMWKKERVKRGARKLKKGVENTPRRIAKLFHGNGGGGQYPVAIIKEKEVLAATWKQGITQDFYGINNSNFSASSKCYVSNYENTQNLLK